MARFSDIRLEDRLTFYVTCGIFAVAAVTAVILIRQAGVMEGQLDEMRAGGGQTERLIILSTGQMASSAKTAGAAQIQAQAARDSVEAIRRQIRQDQRAWIQVFASSPMQMVESKPLSLSMVLHNLGKTPAKEVYGEFYFEKVKNGDSPSFSFSRAKPFTRLSMGLMLPNQLSKNEMYRAKTDRMEAEVLTSDEEQELRVGKAYVAVYARIKYLDIFKVAHWNHYCGWFVHPVANRPDVMFSSRKCSDYNNVDNN